MSTSVLQSWLEELPLRMQSTLILGLRGPDTHACPNVKAITRWLRGLTFKPANPENIMGFMGSAPERIKEKSPCFKELEFCSIHFYSHLMHSLEVVAYRHPNRHVQELALGLFSDMCSIFHLPIESLYDFELRLRHIEWPNGQPDNFADAIRQLNSRSPE